MGSSVLGVHVHVGSSVLRVPYGEGYMWGVSVGVVYEYGIRVLFVA